MYDLLLDIETYGGGGGSVSNIFFSLIWDLNQSNYTQDAFDT